MPDKDLKISLLQTDIQWESVEVNLKNAEMMISKLGETDIAVLPEMFATGFSMNSAKTAQPMGGSIVSWIKDTASKYNTAIIAGVAISEGNEIFNRLIFCDSKGTISTYDKRHLFRVAGEHKAYSAGSQSGIIHFKSWRIRPFVCYDVRFPVWGRNVVFKDDKATFQYDCAIYIANWPELRREHWTTLLRARSIENQSYIIGVNRIGKDAKNYPYSGDSVAYNHVGKQLSEIEPHIQSAETVTLSAEQLENYRVKFPFIEDADNYNLD